MPIALAPHRTPWGDALSWNDRIGGLQIYEAVYHRRFGLGLVTSSCIDQDRELLVVRFREHGIRWVVPTTAPMCRVPAELLCAAQAAGESWCAVPEPPVRVEPGEPPRLVPAFPTHPKTSPRRRNGWPPPTDEAS